MHKIYNQFACVANVLNVIVALSVYMQHEISQLFKKESLDFCMLQGDKQDGVKYIVTLQSVSWPDCPIQDSITRVKV